MFCRLCLAMEVRMLAIHSDADIYQTYKNLLCKSKGLDTTNYYACYECFQHLCNYFKFQQKCQRSSDILEQISMRKKKITLKDIQNVDRIKSELVSPLSVSETLSIDSTSTDLIKYEDEEYLDLDTLDDSPLEIHCSESNSTHDDDKQMVMEGMIKHDYNNDDDDDKQMVMEGMIKHDYNNDDDDDKQMVMEGMIKHDYNNDDDDDKQMVMEGMIKHDYNNDDDDDKQMVMEGMIKHDYNNDDDDDKQMVMEGMIKHDYNNDDDDDKQMVMEGMIKHDYNNDDDDDKQIVMDGLIKNDNEIVLLEVDDPVIPSKKSPKINIKPIKAMKALVLEVSRMRQRKFSQEVLKTFEGYATVIEMTQKEANNEVLMRRESNNYKNSVFKCNLCYRGFGLEATFNRHMNKHSQKSGDYECKFCFMWFESKSLLRRHVSICHERKFVCTLCPYKCLSCRQAILHMKSHKGKKYTCDVCDAEFSMPNGLNAHRQRKHIEVWQHLCKFCGRCFALHTGLKLHLRLAHKNVMNSELSGPRCDVCDIQFATKQAWKRHLVLSPNHHTSNGCVICGDTFKDSKQLKLHMRTHPKKYDYTEIKPLKINHAPKQLRPCPVCNVMLSNRYESHIRQNHPEYDMPNRLPDRLHNGKGIIKRSPFVCEVCGKLFQAEIKLSRHLDTHASDCLYQCDVCGKSFKSALRRDEHHTTMHVIQELFNCDKCPRQFRFKSSLWRHRRADHDGFRPYKCHLCDKTYAWPSQIKVHMRHAHEKVLWPKKKPARETPARRSRLNVNKNLDI